MKRFSFIAVCCVVLFCFCSISDNESQNKNGKDNEVEFIPELVGEELVDPGYGFSLRPPQNWLPAPDVFIEKLQDKITENSTAYQEFNFEVLYAFINVQSRSFLSISVVDRRVASSNFKTFLDRYKKVLQEIYNPSKVEVEEVTNNNTKFVRYLVTHGDRIILKFICKTQDDEYLQFDYTSYLNVYPLEVKAIESSFASISFK